MDNDTAGTTESPPKYKCGDCQDSGKVTLSLLGNSGPITRDVPCPSCDTGVTLDTAAARTGYPKDVDERMRFLALLALAAFVLGALALAATARSRLGWDAVTDQVNEVVT